MNLLDLFENTNQLSRVKFRGTDHDIGEERYVFAVDGNPLVFNFSSDEDNPDPDSPSFEEILARVQRSGEVRHYRITPAEQQAIAKKIAAERQRYLDQRRQDVSEGHADQQKTIVKRNGQPVGEVGIDRESSPGAGMYYMKHYASGLDLGGYDSREEAMDELRYAMKQGVAEAMKPSDIPPSMRQRLTMRDIEAERPQGAFRFRVVTPQGDEIDFMDQAAAEQRARATGGRVERIKDLARENNGTPSYVSRTMKAFAPPKAPVAPEPEAAEEPGMKVGAFGGMVQQLAQPKTKSSTGGTITRTATGTIHQAAPKTASPPASAGKTSGLTWTGQGPAPAWFGRPIAVSGEVITPRDPNYAKIAQGLAKGQAVSESFAVASDHRLFEDAISVAEKKFKTFDSPVARDWANKWYTNHGGTWTN